MFKACCWIKILSMLYSPTKSTKVRTNFIIKAHIILQIRGQQRCNTYSGLKSYDQLMKHTGCELETGWAQHHRQDGSGREESSYWRGSGQDTALHINQLTPGKGRKTSGINSTPATLAARGAQNTQLFKYANYIQCFCFYLIIWCITS